MFSCSVGRGSAFWAQGLFATRLNWKIAFELSSFFMFVRVTMPRARAQKSNANGPFKGTAKAHSRGILEKDCVPRASTAGRRYPSASNFFKLTQLAHWKIVKLNMFT